VVAGHQPGIVRKISHAWSLDDSVNDAFKGPLGLEQHGGHTPASVTVRVLQRIPCLTAAIWHNDHNCQPSKRSLIAYDH